MKGEFNTTIYPTVFPQECEGSPTSPDLLRIKRKRAHLLKRLPRNFARKKTSFIKSWSAIANSDLLEDCCIQSQCLTISQKRQVNPPLSQNQFHQSILKFPDTNVQFVKGIPQDSASTSLPSQ